MKPVSAWVVGRVENIATSRMRDIARDMVAALDIVLLCNLHLEVVTCTARVATHIWRTLHGRKSLR
jgi:hypothetical protein